MSKAEADVKTRVEIFKGVDEIIVLGRDERNG